MALRPVEFNLSERRAIFGDTQAESFFVSWKGLRRHYQRLGMIGPVEDIVGAVATKDGLAIYTGGMKNDGSHTSQVTGGSSSKDTAEQCDREDDWCTDPDEGSRG